MHFHLLCLSGNHFRVDTVYVWENISTYAQSAWKCPLYVWRLLSIHWAKNAGVSSADMIISPFPLPFHLPFPSSLPSSLSLFPFPFPFPFPCQRDMNSSYSGSTLKLFPFWPSHRWIISPIFHFIRRQRRLYRLFGEIISVFSSVFLRTSITLSIYTCLDKTSILYTYHIQYYIYNVLCICVFLNPLFIQTSRPTT